MNLKFGDKILFDTILERGFHWRKGGRYDDKARWWHEHEVPPAEGIVIGIRTLRNGHVEYINSWINPFYTEEHVKAYLVAFSISLNPVYCPIEGYNQDERNKDL
jgi:hypothetical protein